MPLPLVARACLALAFMVGVAASCGGSGSDAKVCIPGRTNLCACVGTKEKGVQTCLPDGSGYDACTGCDAVVNDGGFAEVSAEVGVLYRQGVLFDPPTNCITQLACQLNVITGGAAVGDYDNDGWPDLFVTTVMSSPVLFRNLGDGTFADVTKQAGLEHYASTNGAAWIDIDNDADLDLYVNTVGEDRYYLYVNDGAGHFTEDAVARGVAMDDGIVKAGTSIAVGDYDRDGYLDLHVAEWGPKGTGDYGFLDPKRPARSRLYRNLGAEKKGHFEDVTFKVNAALDRMQPTGDYDSVFSYSTALVDFDGDDWPDLAVAGDYRTSRFLWNDKGKFTDGTFFSGVAKDSFGMGSAIADLDGDGRLDWYVTSISDGPTCVHNICNSGEIGNHFYHNLGNRRFSDSVTLTLGIHAGFWAWGAEFFDYDNDSDLDLAVTNGADYPFTTKGDFFTRDPMRFWRNDGNGVMVETSESLGLVDTRSGKALVTFDYDKDGDLDLFIANNQETPLLYRNDAASGDYLRVRALTKDGREAIGARVYVTQVAGGPTRLAVMGTGSNFLSQSEATTHFGLGRKASDVAEVRVHWHDTGADKVLTNVKKNQVLVVSPD